MLVQVLEKYPLDLERNVTNDYTMSIVANAYNLLLTHGAKLENLEGVLYTHVSNLSSRHRILGRAKCFLEALAL